MHEFMGKMVNELGAAATGALVVVGDRLGLTGKGVAWGDHSTSLFLGTEKFFRPSYWAHLLSSWIPALEGVREKLERGAKVADVGCGYGTSTILMAEAFPRSTIIGFDIHKGSIKQARSAARKAGVENARFEVARAQDYPGTAMTS
jgi:SAM-dependent methyltransferase